jgi:Domain of unknown function (DUF4129)
MIFALFLLLLAALEATLLSLAATIIGLGPGWPTLFAVALLGRLADWLANRLPSQLERPALGGGALVAVWLALSVATSGGLLALLPGSPELGSAYLLTLITLYLFWRGTQLAAADASSVLSLFGRGGFFLIVMLMLAPLGGSGPERNLALISHLLAFVALGLSTMALSHASEDEAGRTVRLGWRWLLTLAAAVLAVVLVGGLLSGLLGSGTALTALQNLIALLLFPFALVGGALTWLLLTFLGEPLARFIRWLISSLSDLEPLIDAPDQAEQSTLLSSEPAEIITRLATGTTWLMALIPLALLVAAILFMRRRQRRAGSIDEERESLGLLSGISSDLRDLLAGLHNPFARPLVGLRAALASLSGADPNSRVRRSYVQLLLELERRKLPRPPAQTPAEFAPSAEATLGQPAPVETLTAGYERARYRPAGASEADAIAAEQALRDLQH